MRTKKPLYAAILVLSGVQTARNAIEHRSGRMTLGEARLTPSGCTGHSLEVDIKALQQEAQGGALWTQEQTRES